MYGVFRHANGTHGTVRSREWIPSDYDDECHIEMEGCKPGRLVRSLCSSEVRRSQVLASGLAGRLAIDIGGWKWTDGTLTIPT